MLNSAAYNLSKFTTALTDTVTTITCKSLLTTSPDLHWFVSLSFFKLIYIFTLYYTLPQVGSSVGPLLVQFMFPFPPFFRSKRGFGSYCCCLHVQQWGMLAMILYSVVQYLCQTHKKEIKDPPISP